jgi:hypothetical protein
MPSDQKRTSAIPHDGNLTEFVKMAICHILAHCTAGPVGAPRRTDEGHAGEWPDPPPKKEEGGKRRIRPRPTKAFAAIESQCFANRNRWE